MTHLNRVNRSNQPTQPDQEHNTRNYWWLVLLIVIVLGLILSFNVDFKYFWQTGDFRAAP